MDVKWNRAQPSTLALEAKVLSEFFVQVQTDVGLPVISMIAPQLMDLLGSPMRLRLVHTLSLLLLSAVLLSVLAMGGVMAWNLRSGFADYLASRDTELLTRFATYVEGAVERAGGIDALTQRRLRMRELMDGFALAATLVFG